MQKKAARLCCAILLMAVAIAASMGLMSAVFAAQSLRTPDIQAAEAPTEAPLMLVRVLFCTDGEISEITIQDEGGQELQRLIPGRDGSAVSARLEPGRYRAVTTLGEAVFTLLPNASVRAESGPCWSDGEQLHLTAVPVGSVLVQRSLAAGERGCLEFTLTDNEGFERRAVVYPDGAGNARCSLFGVPLGTTYALLENGVQRATVTLTAVSSNQDLWFAYGRDFKVAHVQNGTVVQTDTHAVTEHFDLTAQVLTGHLYGGAFSAEACGEDNVQSFAAGQNAMDFTPEAGATYYIWEPSDVYLAPRNYNAWQHVYGGSNGERGVIATYLLTTIDRTLYQEVGFLSGGSSYVSEKDGASIAYGVVNANKNGTLYQQLFVRNGILNATEGLEATSRDDGYIGLYRWTDGAFYQKDAAFSFQPYWITLDGIRVTGTSVRTCTYRGTGTTDDHQSLGISAKTTGSACTVVSAAETTIRFAETYSLDAATDAPVAPPEPEPKTVTLTLHEGTSTRSITVPTGDQRGKVAPAELGGKVFAGWYTDDAYRTPADLSNVQENRTLYGKYVSYNYLRVEYQRNSFLQGNSITLLSAVDGRGFAETGFVINGKRVAVPQLTERFRVFTAQMVFGRSVSRDALLMTMPYSLQGLQRGAAIEITPYWVTPDGTTVYGEARTLIYEYFTLRG